MAFKKHQAKATRSNLASVLSDDETAFATTGMKATGTAVVPFIFTFSGFFDIAFTPLLYAYICKIWPYNLRARGRSIGLLSTQLAVFFNIFVNPIALKSIEWRY